MSSNMNVNVYSGSIFNGLTRMHEECEFIYIGYIGYDNRRQNVILTCIGDGDVNPVIRLVMRSNIAQPIASGSVRKISVHRLLNLMKKVNSIPPSAQITWNNAYDMFLVQWTEDMYYENNCRKIQKAWLNALYNPAFIACKKRLQHEFELLSCSDE
jgi:hypothetical protein